MVLWTAATAGATLLVQGGVGTIRNATRSSTVVDVQAVAVEVDAPVTATAPPTTLPPVTTTPTTVPPPAPTTPPPTGAPRPTPRPTAPPPEEPPAPPPTPAPVEAPATTAPPAAVGSVTRTISTRGGSATIRFRADEVTVVAATPNAGYAVKIERSGALRVKVEFDSRDAESRIEAWWDAEARHEIREED